MPSRQSPFPPSAAHELRRNPSFIFLVVTTFASFIILVAILYFLYYIWYSLVHRSRTSPFDSAAPLLKLQRFSYKELKSATHGFSDETSIGKGGSGTVYRGILRDGKLVAVKLLDSGSLQAEREFQNELHVLGSVKSPFIVSLLGYCIEREKRLVVYEYMPNRSLQESLFSESKLNLNWARRFAIVLDIARALSFLHLECEPPVIHGDVKPSNVLLDSEYKAKLSDFGLSRMKIEGEFGIDLFSQDLGKCQDMWKSQDLSGNLAATGTDTPTIGTPVESANEVDFALALQASSSSKSSKALFHYVSGLSMNALNLNEKFTNETETNNKKAKGKEVFSAVENGGEDWNRFVSYDDEHSSIDHSKELKLNAAMAVDNTAGTKQWGKDWWWKQEGSGELCSKDYVTEWIGSQICPSSNPDWDEEKKSPPQQPNLGCTLIRSENFVENTRESHIQERPIFEKLKDKFKNEESRGWKPRKKKKQRKMQEWWKEEHLDELGKKKSSSNKRPKKLEKIKCKKHFKMLHFDLGKEFQFRRRRRNFEQENQNDGEGKGDHNHNMEFSFRKGWRNKKGHSNGGSDMWSGDVFSRELSSTTSMRGTLCYVAPEYGGCGYLMEKGDIYSLGVLILVIVSGRRPLHVLSSPMKLEKANLISWARQLAAAAQSAAGGNILELVDERLKDEYNKEQATLCISLALACLQKMPELRPDIGDIVKILRGEMDLPPLPFEFSPSPPSRLFSRSRRRKQNATSAE